MFTVVGKKQLSVLAIILVVVIVAGSCGTAYAMGAFAPVKKIPVYCTDDANKIAITFDAAWGADKTKAIADICSSYAVKATFFLTGFWIDAFPEQVKYLSDKGFEIGNHSKNHYNMSGLSNTAMQEEIEYVNNKIKEITGIRPQLFRAPFGDYNNALITTLEAQGMYCIQWNVDSLDWKGLSSTELQNRVLSAVQGGSIILCHNNSDHIVEALPAIIEGALAKGLSFVSVGELIYKKNYKIDNTGRQQRM